MYTQSVSMLETVEEMLSGDFPRQMMVKYFSCVWIEFRMFNFNTHSRHISVRNGYKLALQNVGSVQKLLDFPLPDDSPMRVQKNPPPY